VAGPDAEPRHGPRDGLEVPGEVLAAAGLLRAGGRVGATDGDGGVGEYGGAGRLVDDRRYAADVLEVVGDPGGGEHSRHQPLDGVFQLVPRGVVCGAQGATQHAVLRNRVGRLARLHRSPDEDGAGAGVDLPREQQRDLRDEQADGLDEVGGEVRARGMATG
jgi:hypothetical protein